MTDRVETIMKNLGVTKEEALEILQDDVDIDRGEEKEYDLPPEKVKIGQKMANVKSHNRTGVYNWNKRERKVNEEKLSLIEQLNEFLTEKGFKNIQILNKEREILFQNEKNQYFSVTLTQKTEKGLKKLNIL